MKKIIEHTVSLLLMLVKPAPIKSFHLRMYYFFRKFQYSYHTLSFAFRYAPFIKKFGKNSFILGKCLVKGTFGTPIELSIDDNVLIYDRCEFRGRGNIKIGKGSAIGHDNIFSCTSSIRIGKDVITADHVKFYTANHNYSDPNILIKDQGEAQGIITIEDNVWIGANVVLVRNAYISEGAIIGANSVVNGTIPPNEIWAGCPARKIKNRF
ncbi:MAG: acyltransferase [Bacteriovorax sp.]|nr:acyltransferase [Bacteriovorax sp.]